MGKNMQRRDEFIVNASKFNEFGMDACSGSKLFDVFRVFLAAHLMQRWAALPSSRDVVILPKAAYTLLDVQVGHDAEVLAKMIATLGKAEKQHPAHQANKETDDEDLDAHGRNIRRKSTGSKPVERNSNRSDTGGYRLR